MAHAHYGAAEQRAAAPNDLDEAHLGGPAAEVLQRHERKEHPYGHDEEPDGDDQREEPAHAGRGVHGGEPFAEFAPQVRAPVAPRGVGNADEEQRRAGGDGSGDIEQQNVADRGDVEQQGAESRARDVGERDDHLVDARDACQLPLGGQQRHRGLHGRAVEGRAGRAAGQQQVDVPQLGTTAPEEQGEQQRAGGDEEVGGNHRAAAVPAVDVDPHDRAEKRLRQHARDRRQGQHLGRAGLEAHPEDDGVADDRARQDRDELTAPDDVECPFPVLHAPVPCVACRVLPLRAVPLPVVYPVFPGFSRPFRFFPAFPDFPGLSGFSRPFRIFPGSSRPSRDFSPPPGVFPTFRSSDLPVGGLRRREPDAKIRKKGGHRSVRRRNPPRRIYLTSLTIASNAFGSFMARSASTLRFRTIPLALSLPMNCE